MIPGLAVFRSAALGRNEFSCTTRLHYSDLPAINQGSFLKPKECFSFALDRREQMPHQAPYASSIRPSGDRRRQTDEHVVEGVRAGGDAKSPIAEQHGEQHAGQKAEQEMSTSETDRRTVRRNGRPKTTRSSTRSRRSRWPGARPHPCQQADPQVQQDQAEEQFFVDARSQVTRNRPQKAGDAQADRMDDGLQEKSVQRSKKARGPRPGRGIRRPCRRARVRGTCHGCRKTWCQPSRMPTVRTGRRK